MIITRDGSHSLSIPEMNVTYHSLHGAIQESMHVFIEAALQPCLQQHDRNPIHILEVGFGTGLNALLTLRQMEEDSRVIHYTALELYPVEPEISSRLNYAEQLQRPDLHAIFETLHTAEWNRQVELTDQFMLHKSNSSLLALPRLATGVLTEKIHIVYFDAFAPTAQPELWTQDIFEKLFDLMEPGGMLVTYCSKSIVRRAMQAAGLRVEKIQGPWGKREMLRSWK